MLPFPTEAAARAHKTTLLKQIAGRTVSDAVQAFVVEKREIGLRTGTVKRAEFHLRSFFQLDREEGRVRIPYAETGGAIDELQPHKCEQLYRDMVKTCAVDTHRNALAEAKAFGAWCVKQGWLTTNPLAGIKAVGQRIRGKKQLRIDEARKLIDLCVLCVRQANEGDEGAVGVMTAFLLGLRASEVADRVSAISMTTGGCYGSSSARRGARGVHSRCRRCCARTSWRSPRIAPRMPS